MRKNKETHIVEKKCTELVTLYQKIVTFYNGRTHYSIFIQKVVQDETLWGNF